MWQVLKGLLDSQQVEYDCGFYQLLMPADLPVTVVSASTSLLKDSLDIQVPLRPTQDTSACWTGLINTATGFLQGVVPVSHSPCCA